MIPVTTDQPHLRHPFLEIRQALTPLVINFVIHVAVAVANFIPNREDTFEGAGNGCGSQSSEQGQGEVTRVHESNSV